MTVPRSESAIQGQSLQQFCESPGDSPSFVITRTSLRILQLQSTDFATSALDLRVKMEEDGKDGFQKMEDLEITEMKMVPFKDSKYVKTSRVEFLQVSFLAIYESQKI